MQQRSDKTPLAAASTDKEAPANTSRSRRGGSAGSRRRTSTSKKPAEGKPQSAAPASSADSKAELKQDGSAGKAAKPKQKRRLLLMLQGVLLLIVICIGVTFYLQLQSLDNYLVPLRSEPYELESGATARTVVNDLAGDRYPKVVLWAYVKLNADKLSHIQKGQYAIDGITPLAELLQNMTRGDVLEQEPMTVAIVEGMNIGQIEKRLSAQDELKQDAAECFKKPKDFQEETLSKEDLEFLGGAKDTLEGLLMPATYPYFKDDSAKAMLQRALRSMVQYLRLNFPKEPEEGLLQTPYEVLILASIVEKETSLESEKPLIAGVFFNRLKKGMRLQTDAAVMYGVSPDFKGPLKASQLKQDTPYNTYTRTGLPPTPIAMPSATAIDAVLHPAKTDAIYFVAKSYDPRDGHNFASSLREHNRNVAAYKQSVREYKRSQK
ncbi:MAG: endolytic transglycosylase MltG [Proteobacteria bacterium]|uniref:Endolytic murein transglycosylase n=1 Tax=Candidatus Avisuccinivibrio stercorigallinarum TaxID=2840704 RepID=A0A9D9D9D7_9GAMM|nr:endolytic transglycosylase MltG [Candidatus Avisuccinivibrio stercorigallinarum]